MGEPHLLFWLSLFPFTTAWVDESGFARVPVMVYGVDLLGAALAWYVMQTLVVRVDDGPNARVARALGRDLKGKASPVLYVLGICLARLVSPDGSAAAWVPMGLFAAVAGMWLVPDRRLERAVTEDAPTRREEG